MSAAKSFRDLRVYQLARSAASEVIEVSKGFPREERYALKKLDEALGESTETQSWLDDALDSGYLVMDQFSKMDTAWRAIGGMIGRMIDRAADFCKYASDTDYSGTVMEEPANLDEALFNDLDDVIT